MRLRKIKIVMFDWHWLLLPRLQPLFPDLENRRNAFAAPLEPEGFTLNYFFMQQVEEGIETLQDRVLLKGSWQNKRDHFDLRGGVIEESYCHTGVFSEWRISNDGNPTCGRQLYLQKVSLDYAWTFRIYVVRNAPWGEELEEGPLARAWFN